MMNNQRSVKLLISMAIILLACGTVGEQLPTLVPIAQILPTVIVPPTYTPVIELPVQHIAPFATVTPHDDLHASDTPGLSLFGTVSASIEAWSYSPVSSLLVDGWEIRVDHAELFKEFPAIGGSSTTAQGYYLFLFLDVTNRKGRVATFVPYGNVELTDTTGNQYEDEALVAIDAWYYFQTDIGADIAPNETVRVIVVYDVMNQGTSFRLSPGILSEIDNQGIEVNFPLQVSVPPTEVPYELDTEEPYYEPPPTVPSFENTPPDNNPGTGCCKICSTGQACGNSCISRSYTCHRPPGCACNAWLNAPLVDLHPQSDTLTLLSISTAMSLDQVACVLP